MRSDTYKHLNNLLKLFKVFLVINHSNVEDALL